MASELEHSHKRRPGRPPVYIFNKPDNELSENERRLKGAVLKRRLRQNRSYHRKKRVRQDLPSSTSASPFAETTDWTTSTNNAFDPTLQSDLSALDQPEKNPLFEQPALSISLFDLPTPGSRILQLVPDSPRTAMDITSPIVEFPSPTLHTSTTPLHSPQSPLVDVDDTTVPPTSAHTPSLSNMLSIGALMSSEPSSNSRISSLPGNATTSIASLRSIPADPLSPPPLALTSLTAALSPPVLAGVLSGESVHEDSLVEHILNISATQRQNNPHLDLSTSSAATGSASNTLPRGLAVHNVVLADLHTRLATLPLGASTALTKFALFPLTFSAQSATAIAAPDAAPAMPENLCVESFTTAVLHPLAAAGILQRLPGGRFVVRDIARSLLPSALDIVARTPGHAPDADTVATARKFVSHFSSQLQTLDADSLCRDGKARIRAMQLYDAERDNMQEAVRLARLVGGTALTVDFLGHAATVMRYSTAAEERVALFSTVLEDAGLLATRPGMDEQLPSSGADNGERIDGEARVRLALGEAYFDMLAVCDAGEHVTAAVDMLVASPSRRTRADTCMVSSILALLLLAECHTSEGKLTEASTVLAQALQALRDAGLQKSTFAVCCLLSLASVYNSLDETGKALQTVETALSALRGMGFDCMPIFADCLRALGSVHLRSGQADEAQRLFFRALAVMEGWMNRTGWQTTPFQHCTHLDIFVVELIAQTFEKQERHSEAEELWERARQQRRERRLDGRDLASSATALSSIVASGTGLPGQRLFTRHLY